MKTLTAVTILAVIGLVVFACIYPTARYNAGYAHAVNVIARQIIVYEYRDTVKMQGKAHYIHDTIPIPVPVPDPKTLQECIASLNDCDEKLWQKSQPVNDLLLDSIGGIHNITYIPNEMRFFEEYSYVNRDTLRYINIPPSKLPYYVAGVASAIAILTIIFK